jgi:hypothetical protein
MRNISISNIVAYNTGNYSCSITGIPSHYIENVTIDNISLFNRGGLSNGDFKATHHDVPEDEKGYPSKCNLCFHIRKFLAPKGFPELDEDFYNEALKYY